MNYFPRIALVLLVQALWLTGYSQKKHKETPKPPAVKTRIEFSLDTIVQRLDNMHLTLNRINDFQDHGFDTRQVEKQLPEIVDNLQTISNTVALNNSVPEIKNLQLFGVMLDDIQQQLEGWRSSLFRYNNDLINMNAEINAFTRDSVIRQLVKDSLYRKMYTNELRELEQKMGGSQQGYGGQSFEDQPIAIRSVRTIFSNHRSGKQSRGTQKGINPKIIQQGIWLFMGACRFGRIGGADP